jgi:hypothetical protein
VKRSTLLRLCSTSVKAANFTDRAAGVVQLIQIFSFPARKRLTRRLVRHARNNCAKLIPIFFELADGLL